MYAILKKTVHWGKITTIIKKRTYRFAEGPRLQQILVHSEAMTPIATKIRVVTKNPISIKSQEQIEKWSKFDLCKKNKIINK